MYHEALLALACSSLTSCLYTDPDDDDFGGGGDFDPNMLGG
jgi:hypothetical protein